MIMSDLDVYNSIFVMPVETAAYVSGDASIVTDFEFDIRPT